MAEPWFKFAGGKRQLLQQLEPFWPDRFNTYHEPFLGGGAVFFDLASKGKLHRGAVLTDINERLIRAYRGVRDNVDAVVRSLERIEEDWYPLPSKKEEPARYSQYIAAMQKAFDRAKAQDPEADFIEDNCTRWSSPDADMAVWWLTLNRLGFNGMYRVNRQNKFNVPFGKFSGTPRVLHEEQLRAASDALQGRWDRWKSVSAKPQAVDLRVKVFRPRQIAFSFDTLVHTDDLWYADPPYAPVSATSDFTSYDAAGFRPSDQIALAEHAAEMAKRHVHVRLTNSAALWLRGKYEEEGFRTFALVAKRSVNRDVAKRGAVVEHMFVPSQQVTKEMGEPLLHLTGAERDAACEERLRLLALEEKQHKRVVERRAS